MQVFRRIPHYTLHRGGGSHVRRTSQGGRKIHPDGRRDRRHGLGHRRFPDRSEVADGDLRTRRLPQAGTDRLRLHRRGALRHHQRHARRPLHRHADRPRAVRRAAGPLGHPRRPRRYCRGAGFVPGDLHRNGPGLQPGREVPHAGSGSLRRDRRTHARADRIPRAGRTRSHRSHGTLGRSGRIQALRHRLRRRSAPGGLRQRLPFPRHRTEQGRRRVPHHQGRPGRCRAASPDPQGGGRLRRYRIERGVSDRGRRCDHPGLRLDQPQRPLRGQ